MIDFEYTKAQKNAMKQFKRAWNKLSKSGLVFHNCYGELYAYPKELVERVSDTTSNRDEVSDLQCYEGRSVVYNFESEWSDDTHYIILTDKGKEINESKDDY